MAIREITVNELAGLVESGARLVDVREYDEYVAGHVAGAVHAPLSALPDHVEAFATDATTYVICQAGGRSMRACEYLADLGRDVVNVAGGTGAWIATGRDVIVGNSPS